MAIMRRNYPDSNEAYFEGRLAGDFIMSEHIYPDKRVASRIDFAINCASNEYSPRAMTRVSLFALKATALAIQAKLSKNCKVWVRCVYKPEQTRNKKINDITATKPLFEIKKFVVLATSSESMEVVAEDMFSTIMQNEEMPI